MLGQSSNWTEEKLKEYWKNNKADSIEGLYKREERFTIYSSKKANPMHSSKLIESTYYIVKNHDKYTLANFSLEFTAVLTPTNNKDKYIMNWIKKDDRENSIYGNINSNLLRTNTSELIIDNYNFTWGTDINNENDFDPDYHIILNDKFTLIYKPEYKPQ